MNCWYKGKCNLEKISCQENCLRFNNMNILTKNSRLPIDLQYPIILEPDYVDVDAFKNLNTLKDNIEEFVNKGMNLYLWSEGTGNGKTTWASKLLMSYFNRIWVFSQLKCRGVYLYIPTYLNALKTQYLNNNSLSDYVQDVKNADLIVLDDLGVGKLTDFDRNNLLDLIDYRLNNHKSIIFTSNLNRQGITDLFGDRLSSRIYNSSIVIRLRGRDRRGELK